VNARITSLQREVTDADDKPNRLYKLIEDGATEVDVVLKDRLNALQAADPGRRTGGGRHTGQDQISS
jgi:hypothetical protein